MLNNIVKLTEVDLHRIVREVLNEDKLGLLEYHAQQRLPFDDDFYGKKNQAEQYLDWLEEFGKYGKIGNSSLLFQDCVESGVKMAIEKDRIDSFASIDNIVNELMNNEFKYITFDNRNNIYVERSIKISDSIDSIVNDLFSSLTDKYENNVGGCWAFKSGMGRAYCTRENGSQLLLKGWIRLEDVDWLKTCDLNYNHDEFEIRVKPNAKVELFEVIADGRYKLPLYDTLVVSSTYFGNNSTYNGDVATVDNGMGRRTLINRKGEYLNPDLWLDGMGYFKEGFASVYIEDKGWNFVRQDGTLLSQQWFDEVDDFENGFAKVEINGEYNFIKPDSSYLFPNQWFDDVDEFKNGFCKVFIGGKGYNFIRQDGTLLFPNQWLHYKEVGDFENGFVEVRSVNNEYNLINQDGKLVSPDQWFDEVGNFEEGFAPFVKLYDKGCNFIRQDGSYLSPNKWFDSFYYFKNGIVIVKLYDKGYNFINQDGSYLFPNQWFDKCYIFENNFVIVRLKDKGWNFLKPDGTFLSNQWFRYVDYSEGFASVSLKDKGCNFIKPDGTYLLPDQWFNFVDEFKNGFAKVYLEDKGWNFIRQDGSYLSPNKWFDIAYNFDFYYAKVKLNGKEYELGKDGKLYDMHHKLVESRKLRNSYLHRVLNESIKKVLKGNIYRR